VKIRLAYKLFAAFLLTAFLVVALMVGIMRFYLTRNFSEYINQRVLGGLDTLMAELQTEYQNHSGWQHLSQDERRWRAILRSAWPRDRRRPPRVDEDAREALAGGQALDLTPSEFGLLKVLISQPNRVYSRSELLHRVQGYRFEGYDRTIDSHIKNLRKKIDRKLPGRNFIQTVYGIGYKFCDDPER
jgi:hypothetical protein